MGVGNCKKRSSEREVGQGEDSVWHPLKSFCYFELLLLEAYTYVYISTLNVSHIHVLVFPTRFRENRIEENPETISYPKVTYLIFGHFYFKIVLRAQIPCIIGRCFW